MSDFDKVAADWDKNKMHIDRSEAIAKKLLPYIEGKSGGSAMEFGAGTGLLSFLLKDKFTKIVLIDSSREMVNTAKAKIAQSNTKHMEAGFVDLEKDDYHTEPFDVIFTQMVLHHVENIELIFKKFHHLLRPGGILSIADLYTEDGSFHGDGFNGHYGFDPEELKTKLKSTGFTNPLHDKCFTISKEVGNGLMKDFPIFLLIAERN
jgi:2-polyprenyl-3-methyl-5-hydroxy-6-metoxy-1,4-benzoquinol methylase